MRNNIMARMSFDHHFKALFDVSSSSTFFWCHSCGPFWWWWTWARGCDPSSTWPIPPPCKSRPAGHGGRRQWNQGITVLFWQAVIQECGALLSAPLSLLFWLLFDLWYALVSHCRFCGASAVQYFRRRVCHSACSFLVPLLRTVQSLYILLLI